MLIFNRAGLSSSEIKSLAHKAGCSKREIKKRLKKGASIGLSSDYILANDLFLLDIDHLRLIAPGKALKKYMDIVVDCDGVSAYEAYRQLRRAKKEYGISYSNFVSSKLTGADDEALKKAQARGKKRKLMFARRIAEILDISVEDASKRLDHIREEFGYSPSGAYYRQLYQLTDDEIRARKEKDKKDRERVIASFMDEMGWSREQVKKHMAHCNTVLGVDPDIYFACRCYRMPPEDLSKCGNMRDSRKIGAKFNKGSARILHDKARFNQTYAKYVGRKFWVNRDTDFGEFEEFANGLSTLFCKPVDLSLGTGTSKIELEGRNLEKLYEELMSEPKMLVEECQTQHPQMAKFHSSTLNTVRLFTILENGNFDAFASFVRFGIQGVTDNFSAGGIGCEVDPSTGIILTDGLTKDGRSFETHPVTGIAFKGFQIPHWDKVLEMSEKALRDVDSINYVGWDLAIRDDDVVFVEGNATPDLGVHQAIVMQRGELIRPIYEKYVPNNSVT